MDLHHQPCPFVECAYPDAFTYKEGGYGFCFCCNNSYPSKPPTVFRWLLGARAKRTFYWAEKKYPSPHKRKLKWK